MDLNGLVQIIGYGSSNGSSGRKVYAAARLARLYQQLKAKESIDYRISTLIRALHSLASSPRRTRPLNSSATLHSIRSVDFQINYALYQGNVVILQLIFNETSALAASSECTLYKAIYSPQEAQFIPEESPSTAMDLNHQWLGSHYAAVAGRFDSCREASALLANHLVKAYPEEITTKFIKQQGNHYSLYWPGTHNSARAVDGLASLVQQAANADAPVNWLVHGEGARTFANALEILKSQPSLLPGQRHHTQAAAALIAALKKQKVVFSNPRGATEGRLKALCQEVGVEFVKTNINKRDFKSIAAWRQNYSDIVVLLSGLATTGAVATFTKPLSVSGLQSSGAQLVDALTNAVGDPNAAKVATALAAAYVVGKASQTTYKAMNGTYRTIDVIARSTFGRGNKYWYEDDGKLLKAMRG